MSTELILLFDPSCGWCYGAHPALAALRDASPLPWRLLPTGLFAGAADVPAAEAYFWQSDLQIRERTGVAFSETYREQVLGGDRIVLDSTSATLAWHLIASQHPERALDVLQRVQALRYVDGVLVDAPQLATLAADFGLDATALQADFAAGWSEALHHDVAQARMLMRQLNLRGVPVLLLRRGDDVVIVPNSLLFQNPAALVEFVANHA
ncbi:DsbA family protein [Jeongeupia naejangsanensis]|uniref:DsbA family protein n=1 Tax=Jeongeupia naejangsanensis TaxID=613195 RepID=A0ABS2BKI6_9NEIS|nr:DsbA family protein [Jeongeupia naejangsanensis]MBM3115339.1 DsbA family protein [Jeongeupia naejangsanensis]